MSNQSGHSPNQDAETAEPGEVLALKIVCLALGAAFMLGGLASFAAGLRLGGLALLAAGVYVTASSAAGLRHGPRAAPFAPAAATALGTIAALAFAGS